MTSSVLILRPQDINSDSVRINTACFVGSDCWFYSVLVLVGFALVVQNRQDNAVFNEVFNLRNPTNFSETDQVVKIKYSPKSFQD